MRPEWTPRFEVELTEALGHVEAVREVTPVATAEFAHLSEAAKAIRTELGEPLERAS